LIQQTNFEKAKKPALENFISFRTKKISSKSAHAWPHYTQSAVFAL